MPRLFTWPHTPLDSNKAEQKDCPSIGIKFNEHQERNYFRDLVDKKWAPDPQIVANLGLTRPAALTHNQILPKIWILETFKSMTLSYEVNAEQFLNCNDGSTLQHLTWHWTNNVVHAPHVYPKWLLNVNVCNPIESMGNNNNQQSITESLFVNHLPLFCILFYDFRSYTFNIWEKSLSRHRTGVINTSRKFGRSINRESKHLRHHN